MTTDSSIFQPTILHVFHAHRVSIPGQPGFELAAIITLPAESLQGDDTESRTVSALNQAVRATNNIDGSWSLKIGLDSHPAVAPQKLVEAQDRIMGARSTCSGDVIVLNGERVFLLSPFGFTEERHDTPSPAITADEMRYLLEQSNTAPAVNATVRSAHIATHVASFLGIHQAQSSLDEFKAQVTDLVKNHLTEAQVHDLMNTAYEFAGKHSLIEDFREIVINDAYRILDRYGHQDDGTFAEKVDAMMQSMGAIEFPEQRNSAGMRL